MAGIPWVKQYFGQKWYEELHPTVVAEGKEYAVVRLTMPRQQSYVLVRKSGRHEATPHEVLHTGRPQEGDLEKMKTTLAAAEKRRLG